jgi:hypothetical protein
VFLGDDATVRVARGLAVDEVASDEREVFGVLGSELALEVGAAGHPHRVRVLGLVFVSCPEDVHRQRAEFAGVVLHPVQDGAPHLLVRHQALVADLLDLPHDHPLKLRGRVHDGKLVVLRVLLEPVEGFHELIAGADGGVVDVGAHGAAERPRGVNPRVHVKDEGAEMRAGAGESGLAHNERTSFITTGSFAPVPSTSAGIPGASLGERRGTS